ncbi:nuclear body protein SP140-like protein isoform X1 [Ictalurus punctatus]|uniref:Nuclear body protein SP140-like protein isoform X1 n=1 Tax=Ictalurus punctatus TaxID=7998 RepID=A0A2D0S2Z6_ICTPU|nr:nuclear body protein SP140-like protein isoform X1 [Ictalurus punctatus]XP_047014848.1 nuclear body protein SP140-like protein isoform X1 [Ictalurus punctatus]
MNSSRADILLDLVPQEALIRFFRCKKTEISYGIDEPLLFLNQLRDHGLVPEDLYQKVIKMKSKERKQNGVYKILEWLEKQQEDCMKQFWSCVFQEHILQKYPILRSLQTSLLDGTHRINEQLPRAEKLTGNEEKKAEQKKVGTKRKNSADETEEEGAAPSVSSSSQKKPMLYPISEMGDSSDAFEEFSEEQDREQEEEEEEEDSEPVALFEADVLPVSCGSVIGVLDKSRFAGLHCKSIRTDECWCTPEEFVKQGLTLTDGHWKKDILCHGKTLEYLLKMKILDKHPLGCRCQLCYPKNPQHQDKDDLCFICNAGENVVFCTGCPRAFHHQCHLPTLQDTALGSNWMCTFCVLKTNQSLWIPKSRNDALNGPISGNIMHCQYLLLHLYKQDTKRVFTTDPSQKEERYSSVISNPMWLNKVKTKLQKNKYKTVKEFVSDINLIFNNCQTFNKDNKFGKMGAIMKKIFQEEFNTIFKIQ